MSQKKKIVHIQLLPLMSGVQKVSLDELANLDRHRFVPWLVCKCEGEFTHNVRQLGLPVYLIPELERDIRPVNDIKAFFRLYAFFRKERPDIVHTHSSKTGILGRLAAWMARVPLIVHTVHGFAFAGESRGSIRLLFTWLERLAGRVTDRMIVLNTSDATIARDLLGVPASRQALLPNGVDIYTYSPAPPEDRLRLRRTVFRVDNSERVIVGMVGRLWQQKNPQCFVRAAIRVLREHRQVSFFLIGDGEFRSELEAMIQAAGCRDSIHILGWRSDVPALLKALDVMVLPSRWEGMPLAILEAMSSAVPVLASDIPGNNDLVSHDEDGGLFQSDDDEGLATLLVALIRDPQRRHEMATSARNKVMADFTLAERMRKITLLYGAE